MIRSIALALLLLASPAAAEGLDFTLSPKPNTDWASVVVLRSAQPNTPTALDVIPNGQVAEHGTLGRAWIHVCNRDMPSNAPQNCAAMAVTDNAVRFGSSTYGTTPKRIEWLIGNKVVGYLDASTFRLGNFDSKALVKKADALARENAKLRKQIVKQRAAILQLRAEMKAVKRAVKAMAKQR